MKDLSMEETQKIYKLTSDEIKEIEDTAKDSTLFRVSTLLTLKTIDKKVDETNGTVRTHDRYIASLQSSRTFTSWCLGIYAAAILFVSKLLFGLG